MKIINLIVGVFFLTMAVIDAHENERETATINTVLASVNLTIFLMGLAS